MVNKEIISKLNPCKDRFDNFVKHYGDRSFTKNQFMGLKNISHSDKIWVALRLVPKEQLRFIAADIAESVLHIFEKQYPNDLRPRKAIEAARNGIDINDYYAASAASYDATSASAAYAAYAAAAAAFTANYKANANANTASAAFYAIRALPGKKQKKLIRKIILKYWKEENEKRN